MAGSRPDGKGGHFDRQLRGTPEPQPGRCGRKIPRTDPPRYCARYPVPGGTACKHHGGKSLRGPAHPGYRGGRRAVVAKHMRYEEILPPGPRRDGYTDTMAMADLRTLRRQIGLLSGEEAEVVHRLAQGGASATAWLEAGALGRQVAAALKAQNPQAAADALTKLLALLAPGGAEARASRDLLRVVAERRKLAETESRMAFRAWGAVAGDQMLVMLRAVQEAVQAAIRIAVEKGEPEALRQFSDRMRVVAAGVGSGRLSLLRAVP